MRADAALAAGLFGLLGLLLTWALLRRRGPLGEWRPLPIAACMAGLATGFCAWSWLCADGPTAARGALAGLLAGVLSHPPAWFLLIFWKSLTRRPGERPPGPLAGAAGSLGNSFWSLLLAGWLTGGAGALAGALLGAALAP
jgi:hypothetical protein